MSHTPRSNLKNCNLSKVIYSLFVILIMALLFCQKPFRTKTYFPKTGNNAIYQRAMDLKSNLNVLSIASQPGKEDLAALAYFRMGKGATIVSAYLTNGEAGESDIQAEYPPFLAGIRRAEATKAISFLDGEAHFLNMPDIGSVRDTAMVRALWQSDTLEARLAKLITIFHPDIILIAPDWTSDDENPMQQVLYAEIKQAVKKVSTRGANKPLTGVASDKYWNVKRIFAADFSESDFNIPYDTKHPKWKKTYREIGKDAARNYHTLKFQRTEWLKRGDPSYRLIYSADDKNISEMDDGLFQLNTPQLRSLKDKINKLSESILNGKTRGALNRLVAIKDSVKILLVNRYKFNAGERQALFDWNLGLENLHCSLLGVEVKYTVSDTKLTVRQITYLRIDEVTGVDDEGMTEIFFSGTDDGWIINEDIQRKLPLKLHEKYRLVSPPRVIFNFPYGHQKIQSATEGTPYFFFILHRSSEKEKSFVYRARINFSFGPRFVTEILTPIIRMIPGEGVAVRLTNISRDGVKDKIKVNDVLATSQEIEFRLNVKDSSFVDTLRINWQRDPSDGTYLIPVEIGGMNVANFAARKFTAEVDRTKKVGYITGLRHGALEVALRRLNANSTRVNLSQPLAQQLDSLNVLILDRRVLTLKPEISRFTDEFDSFVASGGNLIILAQDASVWNRLPGWNSLQLKPTPRFDENTPVAGDVSSRLLTTPNVIGNDDWNGWLFRRNFHIIAGEALTNAQIPLTIKGSDAPAIVIFSEGTGKRIYVDLALSHQLMNVHPGAFRLLANLISY